MRRHEIYPALGTACTDRALTNRGTLSGITASGPVSSMSHIRPGLAELWGLRHESQGSPSAARKPPFATGGVRQILMEFLSRSTLRLEALMNRAAGCDALGIRIYSDDWLL